VAENITDKFQINLNQNLWGLVVAYGSLGAAERWGLKNLIGLSTILSIVLTISVIFTTVVYTWNYCKKKAGF